MFSEYFSLSSELLLNYVKNLCDEDFRRVCFFALPCLHSNISLFGGELLLRKLSTPSINKFLEYRHQNSPDTMSFSATFD